MLKKPDNSGYALRIFRVVIMMSYAGPAEDANQRRGFYREIEQSPYYKPGCRRQVKDFDPPQSDGGQATWFFVFRKIKRIICIEEK